MKVRAPFSFEPQYAKGRVVAYVVWAIRGRWHKWTQLVKIS